MASEQERGAGAWSWKSKELKPGGRVPRITKELKIWNFVEVLTPLTLPDTGML
jgi:hypothetical protein